ncbi:cobyrinate a,c-diamide synthase [Selenomonas sp. F0473]|uniref:cobyrinate a,c-diamide synthase n=1 Tax=Selenomonas sp. F0473 TaxID=999423 RepID=UPI00029E610E|nr:cobyrinate a,c-diamide synthase [Selenomonas sp. F0473]EKU71750.1 cobyrinic acid a,c-diamide synthase [Selenomonas sp. F0473]
MEWNIPRIVVAATQSGGGKTTLVTGLLAALRARGLTVQSFKVGPDYIDLGYHRMASGRAGHNLDTWLVPESRLTEIFARECEGADIAVIEGVMGLYDGGQSGISSTASIAKALHAPVLLVIDAKSVGASAAATALGFRTYDADVNLAGVLINRLGSATHEEMIRAAMTGIDMPVFGALRRDAALALPERHLGLTPVEENEAAETIRAIGAQVEAGLDIARIIELTRSAPSLSYVPAARRSAEPSCRIGIARDDAFSFYYAASLSELEAHGAQLVPFSPLHDAELPRVDGLIIGGGFPEMFAAQLAANTSMRASIRAAAGRGMPVYAECGGYMYLMETLVDFAGTPHAMAGVFSGTARMTEKLQTVGYVDAVQNIDTVFGAAGLSLHGHEFHFSVEEGEIEGAARPFTFTKMRSRTKYPAGRALHRTLGSYLHLHFAGCPTAAASFVEACRTWDR